MPSDDRIQRALGAVADRVASYRGIVTAARERVRGLLAQGGGADRAALELGAFGAGRLDLDRFAAIDDASLPDAAARARLRRIAGVLDDLANLSDSAFVVDVPPGGRLRFCVANALGSLGRVFSAIAAVDLNRSGRYDPVAHDSHLQAFGFDLWNRTDRRFAPPLVVSLAGSDLRASMLAEFLDGAVHMVLVPSGRCTPAPLVRLITPNTLVLQTIDGAGLDRFSAHAGPAIAAITEPTAAAFLHDPAGGRALWQRMRVMSRPELSRTRLDTWSAAQQAEELAQLDAIAERPSLSDTAIETLGAPGAPGTDPVDRLASWLLAESSAP